MNFTNVKATLKTYQPEICTTLGAMGMVAGSILAARATVKMIEKKDALENDIRKKEKRKPTKVEYFKELSPCYVPAAILETASLISIFSGHSILLRRGAAVGAAYTLSEEALKVYKDKVKKVAGEKLSKKIDDEVAQDETKKSAYSKGAVIDTGHGNTLCYDTVSGRYYYSDVEFIKQCANELNKPIASGLDRSATLNDFYDLQGLEPIGIGEFFGWHINYDLLTLHVVDAKVGPNNTPAMVISYNVDPLDSYSDV